MASNAEVLLLEQCGIYAYKNSIAQDPNTARVVALATLDEYLCHEFHSPYRRVISRCKSLESFLKYAGRDLVRKGFMQSWSDWNYELMHVNSYLNDKRHDHNCFSGIQLSKIPQQAGNKMLLVFYLKEQKRQYEAERANANRKQRITQETIERKNRENLANTAKNTQPAKNGPTLSEQILKFYSTLTPTQKEMDDVKSVKNRIQRMVDQVWPNMNYQICASKYFVSSSANSLALREADIDLCIVVPEDQYRRDLAHSRNRLARRAGVVYNMFFLASRLKEMGMEKVEAIGNAQVPICKFVDPQTGYQCDINTHNILGIENTKMIKKYCSLDSRIRPLMFAIKYFVKQKNLNNPLGGTLSSYTYVIMLLRFLMSGLEEPVIPNLQINAKQCVFHNCNVNLSKPVLLFHENRTIKCDARYHDCMYVRSAVNKNNDMPFIDNGTMWEGHNNQTVGQLFYAFLQYYSSIDKFTLSIVSANGELQLPTELYPTNNPFVIQDPFIRSKNIARSCTEIGADIIMKEFHHAHLMLSKGSTFAEICDPLTNLKRPIDIDSMEYRFSQRTVKTQQKQVEVRQEQHGDKVIDTTREETKRLAKVFGFGVDSSDEETSSKSQTTTIKTTTHTSINTANSATPQSQQNIRTVYGGTQQTIAEIKIPQFNGTKNEKTPARGDSSGSNQKKADKKPILNLIETLLDFKPEIEGDTSIEVLTKPCTDMSKLINTPAIKDVSPKDICYLIAQLNFLGDALAEKLTSSEMSTTPIPNGNNSDSLFTPFSKQEAGTRYMKELQDMMNAVETADDDDEEYDDDESEIDDESEDDESDGILLNIRGRDNRHYEDDEPVKISYFLHSLTDDIEAYEIYVLLQWYGNVIDCEILENGLFPGWKVTMVISYGNIQQLPKNPDFGHCEGHAYAVINND